MARYIQRIALAGRERWVGWEVDGIGTDIPGMTSADELAEDEIRSRGVKDFRPLPFENAVEMGRALASDDVELVDEDVEFRLDALMVGLECFRMRGQTEIPRAVIAHVLGDRRVADPRVASRVAEWIQNGAVELVGDEQCYLRIRDRLA
jgi:hypothetical protein